MPNLDIIIVQKKNYIDMMQYACMYIPSSYENLGQFKFLTQLIMLAFDTFHVSMIYTL